MCDSNTCHLKKATTICHQIRRFLDLCLESHERDPTAHALSSSSSSLRLPRRSCSLFDLSSPALQTLALLWLRR
ncbi:hypothetical protein PAHAL_6G297400 [Panicum hallii]|uniref:Uncharacterized protein n=1 Tax=Panicum hallii TaxID=206008 RepID=A0A2T8IIC7_9POAL|nr:hypothetical protein PAHAL_6G297400 [Panicum hallii]